MKQTTKEEIEIVLNLLGTTLQKNEVSIALVPDKRQIAFFDTKTYLETGKFDGIAVDIDSLVKGISDGENM